MVMKAQSAMKLQLHAFFIFSINRDKSSALGSKETADSDDRVDLEPRYNMVMTESPFPFGNQTHIQ
jgi:hypothetical protein